MTCPLDQPLVFLVRSGLGSADQHDWAVIGYPVDAAQPGVIQKCLIVEVEQALLVDGAGQNVKQRTFKRHGGLHLVSRRSDLHPGIGTSRGPDRSGGARVVRSRDRWRGWIWFARWPGGEHHDDYPSGDNAAEPERQPAGIGWQALTEQPGSGDN